MSKLECKHLSPDGSCSLVDLINSQNPEVRRVIGSSLFFKLALSPHSLEKPNRWCEETGVNVMQRTHCDSEGKGIRRFQNENGEMIPRKDEPRCIGTDLTQDEFVQKVNTEWPLSSYHGLTDKWDNGEKTGKTYYKNPEYVFKNSK